MKSEVGQGLFSFSRKQEFYTSRKIKLIDFTIGFILFFLMAILYTILMILHQTNPSEYISLVGILMMLSSIIDAWQLTLPVIILFIISAILSFTYKRKWLGIGIYCSIAIILLISIFGGIIGAIALSQLS